MTNDEKWFEKRWTVVNFLKSRVGGRWSSTGCFPGAPAFSLNKTQEERKFPMVAKKSAFTVSIKQELRLQYEKYLFLEVLDLHSTIKEELFKSQDWTGYSEVGGWRIGQKDGSNPFCHLATLVKQ